MEVTIRSDVSGIIAAHKVRICDSVFNVKDWTPFTTVKPDNLSEVGTGTNLWSTANAHRNPFAHLFAPFDVWAKRIAPSFLKRQQSKWWLMRWINKHRYARDLVNGISAKVIAPQIWGLICANLTRYFSTWRECGLWFLPLSPDCCLFFKQHVSLSVWHFERLENIECKSSGYTKCKCQSFQFFPFVLSPLSLLYLLFFCCRNVFHLCDTCQVVTCICYCVMRVLQTQRWNAMRSDVVLSSLSAAATATKR